MVRNIERTEFDFLNYNLKAKLFFNNGVFTKTASDSNASGYVLMLDGTVSHNA